MYSKTTFNVRVTVQPFYIEEESAPSDNQHFWAYHVKIDNFGKKAIQLKSRSWRITDGIGAVHQVTGEGVIGEQPTIEPGKSFEYTSGVPLNTTSAIMQGKYTMHNDEGISFEVDVPTFSLDSPYIIKSVH